jgi:hypothetical protein
LGFTNLGNHGVSLLISRGDNKKIITSNCEITTDGGWSWNSFQKNLSEIIKHYRYTIPYVFDNNYIMLFVSDFDSYYNNGNTFFLVSNDMGKSWEILYTFDNDLLNIFIDPHNHDNITVVKRTQIENWVPENPGSYHQVRKDIIKASLLQSNNGGKSWEELFEAILGQQNIINLFESRIFSCEISDTRYTYVSSNAGLILTKDSGRTWEKIGGINENK